MQAQRHLYENLPETLAIPPEMQHRRVEVILLALDDDRPAPTSLKAHLRAMPNVGQDADFERVNQGTRDNIEWDF